MTAQHEHAAKAVPAALVQSVDRALLVLQTLAGRETGLTALELAAHTGLDRTTIHRLLRTLAHRGMVEQRASRYLLGPQSLLLATGHSDTVRLRHAALPHAIDLQAKALGERPGIVSIAVPAGEHMVIIERLWTPHAPLNIIFEIGALLPIARSPSGRTILSTYRDSQVIGLVGRKAFASLKPQLKRIRAARGLSFGHGEFQPGLSTIACALTAAHDEAVGALVVAGLGMQDDLNPDSPLAQHVWRAAAAISAQLRADSSRLLPAI